MNTAIHAITHPASRSALPTGRVCPAGRPLESKVAGAVKPEKCQPNWTHHPSSPDFGPNKSHMRHAHVEAGDYLPGGSETVGAPRWETST
jgi:hypothetical protein